MSIFGFILLLLNLILSVIIVFFGRRSPKSVWAWLILLYALPGLGFVLYLLLGNDFHKRKMFYLKSLDDKIDEAVEIQRVRRFYQPDLSNHFNNERFDKLLFYNLNSLKSFITSNNHLTVYQDGHEKFDALIYDIDNAKSFIHLQYFIFRNDGLGKRILAHCAQKAAEGVEVRVLYDAIGSRATPNRYWKQVKKSGIAVYAFFPALLGRFHLRINYRNHRKIAIIDGNIAYVGGFNVGDEYLGKSKKFGYWRDTHFRVEGDCVMLLQTRFAYDWNYSAKENLFNNTRYFPLAANSCGNCLMQVISSGPDHADCGIRDNYLWLIANAKKRILIQTPYFIPDEAILNALKLAAKCGIEVYVMIPHFPDHPFVYWATLSYAGELVMAGAKCFTYSNGFLHSKGIVVDGEAFCYGTANFDIRSFELNFEVNIIVYDTILAQKMEAIFMEDLKASRQILKEDYVNRKLWIRFKEQFSRLLSPVL